MKQGSRVVKLENGMIFTMNDGFAYEFQNDILIQNDIKLMSDEFGNDVHHYYPTGNTYTPEQFNEKYE